MKLPPSWPHTGEDELLEVPLLVQVGVKQGQVVRRQVSARAIKLIPAGSDGARIPPLRYRDKGAKRETDFNGKFAFLKIRYKLPDDETSTLITRPVTNADASDSVNAAPREARFAAAVAAFSQLLRGGRYTGDYCYADAISLAQGARGEDSFGNRNELLGLARLAKSLAAIEP